MSVKIHSGTLRDSNFFPEYLILNKLLNTDRVVTLIIIIRVTVTIVTKSGTSL